nr:EOG090X0CJA [Sida crystallina]
MSENNSDQADPSATNDSNATSTTPSGMNALTAHINQNKVDFALWCTRLATILFTLNYFIPILGTSSNMYYKALIANAATSALRLHQRCPNVRLSREFFGMLFLEDSAHYLMYSLIFLYSAPITLVLMPILLFAVLHTSGYSTNLIELLGAGQLNLVKWALGFVDANSVSLLKTIAFSEIFIFPVTILMLISGRATLMTAFVYYRFLTLRYASRRNPYTRNTFAELRNITETYAQKPGCPEGVRNLAFKIIGLISRLAPPVVQSNQ